MTDCCYEECPGCAVEDGGLDQGDEPCCGDSCCDDTTSRPDDTDYWVDQILEARNDADG